MSHQNTNKLTHMGRKRGRDKSLVGIIDIETTPIGQADPKTLAIGWYVEGLHQEVQYTRQWDSLLHLMVDAEQRIRRKNTKHRIKWYIHNGGEYDLKFAFKEAGQTLLKLGKTRLFTGGGNRVIGVHIDSSETDLGIPGIEIYDSYAIWPVSLEKLAKAFDVAVTKDKDAINWDKEMFDLDNPRHKEYLRRDVLALYHVVTKGRDILHRYFGVHHSLSASGTALRAFRTTIPQDRVFFRVSPDMEQFIRGGYYGAITRGRDTNVHHYVVSWDQNSMYPAMMRLGVPTGKPIWVDRFQDLDKPGFYRVEVVAPDDLDPMLYGIPKRGKYGVSYPSGTFATTITSMEYAWGLRHGYQFTFIQGLVFPKLEKIFDDFVSMCETLRFQDYFGALGMIAKIMQNGEYGKHGMDPEQNQMVFQWEPPGEGWSPVLDPNQRIVQGLWERDELVEAPYMMPHWSAWVTANARLSILHMIETLGPAFIYADTDSVKFEVLKTLKYDELKSQYLGTAYGQYKDEGIYKRFQVVGPKTYWGSRTYIKEGILIRTYDIKAKGIPRKKLTQRDLRLAGQNVDRLIEYTANHSTKRVLHGDTLWDAARRKVTTPARVQSWTWDADTRTFQTVRYDGDIDERMLHRQAVQEQIGWDRETRQLAREEKRDLYRRILELDGILPSSEWPDIPRYLIRKKGSGIDWIANHLGFDDAQTLYDTLQKYC